MSRIIKVIDNETIEIASYRNPRIVFNNYRYDDIENYCDFKATINPFVLYRENERLHSIIKEVREYIENNQEEHKFTDRGGFTYTEGHFLRDSDSLLDILQGSDKE